MRTAYIYIPKVYKIGVSNYKLESETHNYYETNLLTSDNLQKGTMSASKLTDNVHM